MIHSEIKLDRLKTLEACYGACEDIYRDFRNMASTAEEWEDDESGCELTKEAAATVQAIEELAERLDD